MCRIFFSLNKYNNKINNKTNELLNNFLYICDQKLINSSYGIVWLENNNWFINKNNSHFYKDKIQCKINNLRTNIFIIHCREISIKTEENIKKENIIENTHPFLYENNTLMFHGDLFIYDDYELCTYQNCKNLPIFITTIRKLFCYIDNNLIKNIRGNTDTEIIFFLFISIKNKISKKHNYTPEKLILKSLLKIIKIVINLNLYIRTNIFYTYSEYVLIAKINKSNTVLKKEPIDLFYNITNDNIIFSSIEFDNCNNMIDNTAILYNLKNNNFIFIEL